MSGNTSYGPYTYYPYPLNLNTAQTFNLTFSVNDIIVPNALFYLKDICGNEMSTYNPIQFFSQGSGIYNPGGIAINPYNNNFYVINSTTVLGGAKTILMFNENGQPYNLNGNNTFLVSSSDQLYSSNIQPQNITFDDSGNLYILTNEDTDNSARISKYDVSGNIISNNFVTYINGPSTIKYHNGYLYLACSVRSSNPDPSSNSDLLVPPFSGFYSGNYGLLVKLDLSGNVKRYITMAGVNDITFDTSGYIYASNASNNSVTRGSTIVKLSETGVADTSFNIIADPFIEINYEANLTRVVYDKRYLYSIDTNTNNIIKMNIDNSNNYSSYTYYSVDTSYTLNDILLNTNYISNTNTQLLISHQNGGIPFSNYIDSLTYRDISSADSSHFIDSSRNINSPLGIVFNNVDTFYISNVGNNTISAVTTDGTISTYYSNSDIVALPIGLAIDTSDNLYVVDGYNSKITKILAGGSDTIIYDTSSYIQGPGGLAIDNNGFLYVAAYDRNNNWGSIIQLYNMTDLGDFSYNIITPLKPDGNPYMIGVAGIAFDVSYNLYVSVTTGNNPGPGYVGKFSFPQGIDVSFNDYIFDASFSKDPSGNLYNPTGIVCDPLNNIYVGSTNAANNGSVYQIDPSGNVNEFLTNIPTLLVNNYTFNYPAGITLDSSGNLLIADNVTNTIFKVNTHNLEFTDVPTSYLNNGTNLLNITLVDPLEISGIGIDATDQMACFLQGTTILTDQGYKPIETLRKGTLVKTLNHGYVKVMALGTSQLYNSGNDERIKNRLYRYSKTHHIELTDDLIITGCHSVLVDKLTDVQEKETLDLLGQIYITDNKYRLMAQFDEKAKPYHEEGRFDIWHLALEHEDPYMNYGIYANGILVETTSIRFLYELSNMVILT